MARGARLGLSLLGGFEARLDASPPLVLSGRKTQALLAYLALPPGRPHPRERLAALLWSDMQDTQARGNLRQALSSLRKALPATAFPGMMLEGPAVALDPSAVDVDVTRFEALVDDGRPPALEEAAGLYRGGLLSGLAVSERPFDEWLLPERERLRELAIHALGRLLMHQQEGGAAEAAVQTGLRLLALDPLQEPVHRTVMRLYAHLGRREAALRHYELCVDILRRELGAPPEAETTRLHDRIRGSRPGARDASPDDGPTATATGPTAAPPSNLPQPTSELIGRATAVAEVRQMLTTRRLVTLIGAGGVGKTRLALEAARGLLPLHADGVWIAELAPLSDPALVPVTVAIALGLTVPSGVDLPERVAAAVGPRRLLLVLDNCEHVIEAAARMAEALLEADPHAHVLVTSREPLRAPGEHVYRVLSLEVPTEAVETHEDLIDVPAVKLFAARAQAMDQGFTLDARGAAIAGAVCRRLDGIPLAIELAAARIPALGIEGLAAHLDDRFRLLTRGHRTALPRHQTLRATLDWSYNLLSAAERTVLHRLAVFAGAFTLDAAAAVAGDGALDATAVAEHVAILAAKSLVVVEATGATNRYRLLETTRAYALEKLGERGELDAVARRHATHYRDLLARADHERATRSPVEWLTVYGWLIYNVRAALDWAFSPRGDAAIGAALTTAAVPIWLQQSLLLECRGRVERALASFEWGTARDAPREMLLHAALGVSLMHTAGAAPETIEAWTTALALAERLDDREYQLRSLWGIWHFHASRGECRRALAVAERFRGLAADGADRPVGERMVGAALHYLGEQTQAREQIERMLGRQTDPVRRAHAIRFQYDQQIAGRMILARILWLQGFPDQARRAAEESVADARRIDHALSICNALEIPCLVALWSGDAAAAERAVSALLDHSARHALTVRHLGARCFQGAVMIERGAAPEGLDLLRTALDELRETSFVPYFPVTLGMLARGLARADLLTPALVTVDEALAKCERDEERWWIAELLRIKAEVVRRAEGPAARAVEEILHDALGWTHRQGSRSLELRCATDLGRLWHEQGRVEPARALLAPVVARFSEGLDGPDMQAATRLLDGLG